MANSVKLSKVPDSSPGPKIVSGAEGNSAAAADGALRPGPASDQELADGLGTGDGVDRGQVEAIGQGDRPHHHGPARRRGGGQEQLIANTSRGVRGASHGMLTTLRIRRDMKGASPDRRVNGR